MQELYLGKPHWRITKKSNSKHDQQEIPPAFQSIIDMLHDKFSISDEQKLNSIVIQKFSVHRAELREQSHSNPLINPDSTIFNICLADSCSVTFRNKCSNDKVNLDTVDNSLYSMSYKSQLYWTHKIEAPVQSDKSVHYSITFQSINQKNANSTLIVGDSNTNHIYFAHEKQRSNLGGSIYGRRIRAFPIEEICPTDCIGFQNIMLQVGLNNLKNKFAVNGTVDVCRTFDS